MRPPTSRATGETGGPRGRRHLRDSAGDHGELPPPCRRDAEFAGIANLPMSFIAIGRFLQSGRPLTRRARPVAALALMMTNMPPVAFGCVEHILPCGRICWVRIDRSRSSWYAGSEPITAVALPGLRETPELGQVVALYRHMGGLF